MWRLVCVFVLACTALDGATQDLAITGALIYPTPAAAPLLDGVVVIRAGRIAAAGPSNEVSIPRDVPVLDAAGLTLTAGFWNSHVHFSEPKWENAGGLPAARLAEQLRDMCTGRGFTTVVDTGSSLENTLALRRRVESGEVPGPRILTAGEPLYPRGGIPAYIPPEVRARLRLPEVDTVAEAEALVAARLKRGADAIKLFAGSWMGRGKVVEMRPELLRAAAETAHRLGKPVLAHPQSFGGLKNAAAAGVDVLVHTTPAAGDWDAAMVGLLKRANVALIPTLKLWRVELEKDGVPAGVIERFQARARDQVRSFLDAGGPVLFGTDVGYIPDYDTAEEFEQMWRAGMSFREILASLTTAPAARFGAGTRSGRVAPGFDADLVLLEGDPALDAAAFTRIRYVIRAGKVVVSAAARR